MTHLALSVWSMQAWLLRGQLKLSLELVVGEQESTVQNIIVALSTIYVPT